MKSKMLFMLINMNIGGTEKALLNRIAEIPEHKYDITILMLEKYGGFLNAIPNHVNVEYVHEYSEIKGMVTNPPRRTIWNLIKKGRLIRAITFSLIYGLSRILKNKSIFLKYILRNIADIKNEYDVAIAYAGPMDLISYFVIHKISAEKKLQWIHFDVTKVGFDLPFAKRLYPEFDRIYTVSNEGKDLLVHILPELQSNIDSCPNKISSELILQMADEGAGFNDEFDGIRILTIGRLSKEKGQDLVIPVLAKLKEKGYKVRWYCVGEGNSRSAYEFLIKKYHVEREFILLGAHPNPYPFLKQCDIYVQPSRHEGFCITLGEAKVFGKPIITTNFTGAHEQIVHQKNGLITNIDEEEIYNSVEYLISNEEKRKRFEENLIIETQKILVVKESI
ncbi:glycosyltransferase [Oceanobacillus sojae]|uniref:glycosyltransferase n=1 Tax=Oceanobacillus sojae TaxID=582851 RepID=UPI00098861F3|nr:glycosyltransferase [Oceanobacillus sojae]